MHGGGEVRELDAEEAVGGLAVAAARKKASDATKGVCHGDDAGREGEDVQHSSGQTATQDEIHRQEGDDASDQSAEEGDAAAKAEARSGIFDIVVGCLKQSSRSKSDCDRGDSVEEYEIGKALVNADFFCIIGKTSKSDKDSDGDHDAVHMNV